MIGLGERMLSASLGAQAPAAPYRPYDAIDTRAVLADFASRLADLEQAVTLAVPSDRITSMLALTSDTALISAEKIAVVGETTFFDWMRDVSGQATGVIDPSITQIRGGVIRTGTVANLSGTSYVNLDAVTTGQTFIQCASALSIMADGQFIFGSSTGKKLIWDGIDLKLGASSLLDSTSVSTVVSNAAAGASAYASLGDKLNKAGGDILTGIVDLQVTSNYNAGIRVGDATWNTTTGALTGGSGVIMTRKGLMGVASGVATFTLDATTGAATFAGALNGATGTFAGDISTAGSLLATGSTSYGGYVAAIRADSIASNGYAFMGTASGVNGIGVYGFSTGSGGYGLYGAASGGGSGAAVSGYGTGGSYGVLAYATGADALRVSGSSTFSGQITSTVSSGTAPFVVSSTSVVGNLYATYATVLWDGFAGRSFSSPGAIGGGTAAAGSFTTLGATGQITSTLANGTKPLNVTSKTVCTNLNAEYVGGVKFGAVANGTGTVTISNLAPAGVATATISGWTTVINDAGTIIGYQPYWI